MSRPAVLSALKLTLSKGGGIKAHGAHDQGSKSHRHVDEAPQLRVRLITFARRRCTTTTVPIVLLVGNILKGFKPTELPVQQVAKVQLLEQISGMALGLVSELPNRVVMRWATSRADERAQSLRYYAETSG